MKEGGIVLSCHLYNMPFSNIDTLYRQLSNISGQAYIYVKQAILINNKHDYLYASFYDIKKSSNIIFGSFGFQYIDSEFNIERNTVEKRKRTNTIDFAIFNYRNKTYLCIFSSKTRILIEELERKLYGNYQARITIVYITREQLRNIIDHIPHRAYGTAFDGLRDINGWSKLHVFGSNVEQPPEYSQFSERSIEPDKDYFYADYRYKNRKGEPYKFRIIRKGSSSSKISDTLTILCYNISATERDRIFLIEYIKNNILSNIV